jgi:hypothetical protein
MPTYRERFIKKYNLDKNKSFSIKDISKITNIPESILQEVYNRGIGAWKTNIASVRLRKDFSKNSNMKKYPKTMRLTKEQWAYARIYSFVMGGKTTVTADKDLFDKLSS